MVKIWIVLAYVIGIIILGFSYAFEYIKYGQTGSEKYNFLRNFPYELNQFKIDCPKSYILMSTEIIGSSLFSVASFFFEINYQNVNITSAYILFFSFYQIKKLSSSFVSNFYFCCFEFTLALTLLFFLYQYRLWLCDD